MHYRSKTKWNWNVRRNQEEQLTPILTIKNIDSKLTIQFCNRNRWLVKSSYNLKKKKKYFQPQTKYVTLNFKYIRHT